MEFEITPDHPSLPGHFPGRPLVPGVVLLERVLAAIETTNGPLGPLRLPQVKFVQPLLPGQAFDIALDAGEGRWRFRVVRDGQTIASGEVACA
jgi:3-hydroxymyristoyl/3-hydroxydecanoyl-(acyl carrier protein) dehydratase